MTGAMRKRCLYFLGAVIILIIITVPVVITYCRKNVTLPQNKYRSTAPLGKYKEAAVSAMGQECAQIGVSMLKKNGSAVDATIATLLCEGVASLHSMGLGGGFLMTIWDAPTKTAHFLDARETAPRKATEDMFQGNAELSFRGGLSVAVPGELLGYWEAHKKFGRLKWEELFQPTIELCRIGTVINNYLGGYLKDKEDIIKKEATLAEILINPVTNKVYKVGERIKRRQLAKTLELISKTGISEFYNKSGSIARDLSREIQAFKGIIDEEDFNNYKVVWSNPLMINISKLKMYTAPPPGSGPILGFIMNVLENSADQNDEKIVWQHIVETFKWAYARRTELGDPLFQAEVINNLVRNLTSKEYAASVKKRIKDNWTSNDPKFYGVKTSTPNDSGTCHVSVLAPDGSAVSVTSTINQIFGALFRSKSTGIIFNDEMDDFSSPNITNAFDLPPSPANYIKSGKRPLSSMVPTIFVDENDEVRLVIGAAGGTKITTAVAIATSLNIWKGYNIKEAIDAHRIHHQLFPMKVENEKNFPLLILNFLHSIGHNVTQYHGIGSAVTGIVKENGIVTANSDYRREGSIAGF